MVEYESEDGSRVARIERIGAMWLVILRETLLHSEVFFREEHDTLSVARKACRYYVMKLRQARAYQKGVGGRRRKVS